MKLGVLNPCSTTLKEVTFVVKESGSGDPLSLFTNMKEENDLVTYLSGLSFGSDVHILDGTVVSHGAEPLIRIVVDTAEGITIGEVASISRQLRRDEILAEMVGSPDYRLEVTSPGIETSLREPWQFNRHIGRQVKIHLRAIETELVDEQTGENQLLIGQLLHVDQEGIILNWQDQERRLLWDRIDHGQVQLDW